MKNDVDIKYVVIILAIGRSENPEGGVLMWWVQYAPSFKKS